MLMQAQIDHFRRVGYMRLPHLLSPDLLQDLTVAFNELFSNPSEPMQLDNETKLLKVLDLYGRGGRFKELIESPLVLDVIEQLLGPNIVFLRFRHNYAAINRPGENVFTLHRDALQWSKALVGLLIYLDESSVQSGCTYVIPASHYLPFFGEATEGRPGIRADSHPDYLAFADEAVPIELGAGGALLFDGGIFHSISTNRSTHTRRTVALSYQAVDELAPNPEDERRVLVRGKYLYRGWDDSKVRAVVFRKQ